MTDPIDLAWKMLRDVIEEAEGRYGLELHGRVIKKKDSFRLDFVDLKTWRAFSQEVAPFGLETKEDAEIFTEFGVYPALRELAAWRDRR